MIKIERPQSDVKLFFGSNSKEIKFDIKASSNVTIQVCGVTNMNLIVLELV